MPHPKYRPAKDLLEATTVQSFKCPECGNMYPVEQGKCGVCGHDCTKDTCQILNTSNQDY